ncbi:Involved in the final reduction of the elongation cycle of fatty acid synthesis (FAS II). Catalyzes the reduction of a carbon-carbon double bond in an enoyl moiety that is covalently linked to an acyl carrier protein (ACP) [Vibrio sp. B1FIG11]|uniref:enoyl-ACP reductase FabV n=1 Tax=Vibrio sp. B1FIG11 TaxID=2751177 RepID=UPI001AF27CBB|nr:enoyl-ACP reductase FabV [Vibrio sp. B1FIG11]CAD7823811.1 Involved in the final reduction of the elongation cycle of fatty acid synthesis (FAS II). Catalyzes the reduction of a carbon-carbon double bond in an enoyl moiety that is covalently linked to an acyl carrier protein (ACP) [Vibrio sp. B1FIG11]CAE6950646.1 Involved in the final reduction of the elongation cycle of fatty acid synthesis (FAS II). Catalyzes the reduction of a carbon-carbon double bond in an enoyl moiety that is covalently l
MQIEPLIQGVVARSAHPYGCRASIKEQIEYVKQAPPIKNGPKRVLIIGASSGFGLAARIALTFGGAEADTIGVSFERGPSDKGVGSAGWYNNIYFKDEATHHGRTAVNIVGDAFSDTVRNQVIEAIETYFEGEVDLVIYSLATGVRPKPESDEFWRSVIKPIGESVTGASIMLENDQWVESTLAPATEEEAEATIKVMGGEDWESWIDTLINSESVAKGCKTIAFSYMGPEVTHPIYLDGTLGRAKVDLHQTSHSLNIKMANFGGGAYATVCKALVTKASVFIPALSPYLLALYRVMKEKGTHERCIEQMQRLFTTKLYDQPKVPVDGERLIRIDDLELDPEVQKEVSALLEQMNADNFAEIGDYEGFKDEFMKLNGFNFEGVDYTQDISMKTLKALKP